jgi:formylglycine-generating enzyme required for sulfatase activity
LQQKGGLILFDGLDEVPEAESRREQIIQIVHQVKEAYPACRVMVTSRLYAYRRQDWALEGFDATVLAPFSRGQIIRFVDRWYAHIAQLRGMSPQDAQGRAQLLKRAVFASDRLQALAERPLLLTLMASLHAWRGGSLPEKREQLYSDTVDLLLDWWEKRRVVRKADGTVLWMSPSLAEYLNVGKDRLRALLNQLAYEAHARQPDLQGTADIPEDELVRGLLALTVKEDIRPRRLVEYLRDRAGLLIPRGVGVYTFPHRTFQEYLAACYLTDDDYPDKVAELAKAEPDRWREVALLAGAKAARGAASTIWNLTEALCCEDVPEKGDLPADSVWGAYLAGQALAESADLHQVSKNNQPKLERVQKWLVAILERSPLPAIERARAGDTLAALGDPRFDRQRWYLPATSTLGFLCIPKGKFLMGSSEQDKNAYDVEKPQHELDLPYDYWIAKYPVTVAQWCAFVEASGYRDFDQDALRDPDNRPVRFVSWHAALAYCRWLDGVLKAQASKIEPQDETASAFWGALASGNYRVTLPSEAEWEKAARGPIYIQQSKINNRIYPWGNTFDPNKANTDETGLGTTTAVGAFPLGISPYGCLDMSGNVWEWTRTLWDDRFGYPYNRNDGREDLKHRDRDCVVRGGSFINHHRNARCAFRYRFGPGSLLWDQGFRVVVSPI